jgi:hypothetical protein
VHREILQLGLERELGNKDCREGSFLILFLNLTSNGMVLPFPFPCFYIPMVLTAILLYDL